MDVSDFTKELRKVLKVKTCGAVIVAAGNASRMGGIDKVMAPLMGEPMILRTVRKFQECDVISHIVVVTRSDLVEPIRELCSSCDKVGAVVVGGQSRQESVLAGLYALPKKVKLAAVHDGARPLISWQVIDRVVRAAHTYGAAAPGVPMKDTVKEVAGGLVKKTPDRASLQAVQTPQVFDMDVLKAALEKAKKDKAAVTDDCSAVERIGMSVRIVPGDERNIKVTTATDLKIAQLLMEESQ